MAYSSALLIIISVFAGEWLIFRKRVTAGKEDIRQSVWQFAVSGLMLVLSLFICYQFKMKTGLTGSLMINTGIGIFVYGAFLRLWTHIFLFNRCPGYQFVAEQPLFSNGPFRFYRHPFQTGYFLMVLGGGLYLCGHWIAGPVIFVLLGSALHPVMQKNEQALEQRYGEIYKFWSRRRCRLLPFLY